MNEVGPNGELTGRQLSKVSDNSEELAEFYLKTRGFKKRKIVEEKKDEKKSNDSIDGIN